MPGFYIKDDSDYLNIVYSELYAEDVRKTRGGLWATYGNDSEAFADTNIVIDNRRTYIDDSRTVVLSPQMYGNVEIAFILNRYGSDWESVLGKVRDYMDTNNINGFIFINNRHGIPFEEFDFGNVINRDVQSAIIGFNKTNNKAVVLSGTAIRVSRMIDDAMNTQVKEAAAIADKIDSLIQ